jgi:orotate phosphoribosyltransferase
MKSTNIETQFKKRLVETEAFLEGHFLLSGQLHSKQYIQCQKLLQHWDHISWVCEQLSDQIYGNTNIAIDVVIGPAQGGTLLSCVLASFLRARGLFAERENGTLQLRRGQEVDSGDNVLIVDDVFTTGRSFIETKQLVEGYGGNVVGLACLVDRRSHNPLDLGELPLFSLLSLNIETFSPEGCPLCDQDVPLVKPGSRKEINK